MEKCVPWGSEAGSGLEKVCCNPLVMSAMHRGAGAGATVLSCRSWTSRTSKMHPGSTGCLAWASKPIQPFSVCFQVRKQILSVVSQLICGRAGIRIQVPRIPVFRGVMPSLFWPLGSSEWSFSLVLRCHISLGPGAFLSAPPLGFILSAGPPVEQAGHKLSTINKTKTSVLALTLVSWCIFFLIP